MGLLALETLLLYQGSTRWVLSYARISLTHAEDD